MRPDTAAKTAARPHRAAWIAVALALLVSLTGATCRAPGARTVPVSAEMNTFNGIGDDAPPVTPPRFTIHVPPGRLNAVTKGRLLILAAPDAGGLGGGDMRGRLDDVEASRNGATWGYDMQVGSDGGTATVDTGAGGVAAFPSDVSTHLAPGAYRVQAVFAWNPEYRGAGAPGNLYSEPETITLPVPHGGLPFDLRLTEQQDDPKPPADDDTHKYLALPSARLSNFYTRPTALHAGVVLPPDYTNRPARPYILYVRAGGFHTRYTAAAELAPHAGVVQVLLDGDGPFGDPYQVNSAVSGPFGDATVRELIPEIERRFHCGGSEKARFTAGGSTGGWVSLALQVYYPTTFGGCWSGYPDPLDFHSYESINLYDDANAYAAADGSERVSMRDRLTGAARYTVREECALENVSGFGGIYTTSGGQWGAWNTVFGARNKDGRATPFWDPHTGMIDHATVRSAARRYDLRAYCERRWKTLAPKLAGKIHLYVGEHDEYFLNEGVHKFDTFLKTADPPASARVEYDPLAGHGFEPRSRDAIMDEMLAVRDGATGTP